MVARDVAELQQVLASLSGRGGQRLVTYLRLGEVKPPSPLPLGPPGAPRPSRAPPPRPPAPVSVKGAGGTAHGAGVRPAAVSR